MVDRLTDFYHPVNPGGYIRANSYCSNEHIWNGHVFRVTCNSYDTHFAIAACAAVFWPFHTVCQFLHSCILTISHSVSVSAQRYFDHFTQCVSFCTAVFWPFHTVSVSAQLYFDHVTQCVSFCTAVFWPFHTASSMSVSVLLCFNHVTQCVSFCAAVLVFWPFHAVCQFLGKVSGK